jgi:hypothetical protein
MRGRIDDEKPPSRYQGYLAYWQRGSLSYERAWVNLQKSVVLSVISGLLSCFDGGYGKDMAQMIRLAWSEHNWLTGILLAPLLFYALLIAIAINQFFRPPSMFHNERIEISTCAKRLAHRIILTI